MKGKKKECKEKKENGKSYNEAMVCIQTLKDQIFFLAINPAFAIMNSEQISS